MRCLTMSAVFAISVSANTRTTFDAGRMTDLATTSQREETTSRVGETGAGSLRSRARTVTGRHGRSIAKTEAYIVSCARDRHRYGEDGNWQLRKLSAQSPTLAGRAGTRGHATTDVECVNY